MSKKFEIFSESVLNLRAITRGGDLRFDSFPGYVLQIGNAESRYSEFELDKYDTEDLLCFLDEVCRREENVLRGFPRGCLETLLPVRECSNTCTHRKVIGIEDKWICASCHQRFIKEI